MSNKVTFGLKNAYYAKITRTTDAETGVITTTYGTPKPLLGAVSVSLEATGENTPYYADDSIFYTIAGAKGYEGDYESAGISRDFKIDILGDIEDSNGNLIEVDNPVTSDFAFMFETSGDIGGQRVIFYNCSAARPAIGSATKEESTEVQNTTISIKAKSSTKSYTTLDDKTIYPVQSYIEEGDTGYSTFFSSVYEPTFTAG